MNESDLAQKIVDRLVAEMNANRQLSLTWLALDAKQKGLVQNRWADIIRTALREHDAQA